MKYIFFNRESNNFEDILKDPSVKKHIKYKSKWSRWLLIGVNGEESLISYINVKYGDDIKTNIHPDFTPVAGKDYIMDRKK